MPPFELLAAPPSRDGHRLGALSHGRSPYAHEGVHRRGALRRQRRPEPTSRANAYALNPGDPASPTFRTGTIGNADPAAVRRAYSRPMQAQHQVFWSRVCPDRVRRRHRNCSCPSTDGVGRGKGAGPRRSDRSSVLRSRGTPTPSAGGLRRDLPGPMEAARRPPPTDTMGARRVRHAERCAVHVRTGLDDGPRRVVLAPFRTDHWLRSEWPLSTLGTLSGTRRSRTTRRRVVATTGRRSPSTSSKPPGVDSWPKPASMRRSSSGSNTGRCASDFSR